MYKIINNLKTINTETGQLNNSDEVIVKIHFF